MPSPDDVSSPRMNEADDALNRLRSENDYLKLLVHRLSRVSASSAEAMTDLEEREQTMIAVNRAVAIANAQASELVAEISIKNSKIAELNRAVSFATARASEVVAQLEEAISQVKELSGTIPICMHCHQIRDEANAWNRLEKYIEKNSAAHFSHGICPSCIQVHYPGAME